MSVCLPENTHVHLVCACCLRGQNGAQDPLGLELQMPVSGHVGAGSQIWVLHDNSKCC